MTTNLGFMKTKLSLEFFYNVSTVRFYVSNVFFTCSGDKMGELSYSIPLVAPELRREETIHQICDALEYVDKVANDVFNRISSRVADNQARLKKVNERVSLAQAKIDAIKGTKKATKVFSGSKYPSVNEEEHYRSVYSDSNGFASMKKSNYRLHQVKHPAVDEKVLKEKLQFYNVLLGGAEKRNQVHEQEEGLGSLPKQVKSIGSLLLFNTSENP